MHCRCVRTFPGIEGDDGVSETSSSMRDGGCTVRHGIQLVEPAGLKAGGHEEDVGGSSDFVAHGNIEAHPAPRPVRVSIFYPPHPRLRSNQDVGFRYNRLDSPTLNIY